MMPKVAAILIGMLAMSTLSKCHSPSRATSKVVYFTSANTGVACLALGACRVTESDSVHYVKFFGVDGKSLAKAAGERYPQTRIFKMKPDQVVNWDLKTLRYAINEIYARHQAEFKKQEVKRQFDGLTWYGHGVAGRSAADAASLLTSNEKSNLNILAKQVKVLEPKAH